MIEEMKMSEAASSRVYAKVAGAFKSIILNGTLIIVSMHTH